MSSLKLPTFCEALQSGERHKVRIWSAAASTGQEALAKEDGSIRLVILDWNMPVMMLSTESEKQRMSVAMEEGASNYCVKPFTAEALASKILECVGEGG